jgi:hypothetical protein
MTSIFVNSTTADVLPLTSVTEAVGVAFLAGVAGLVVACAADVATTAIKPIAKTLDKDLIGQTPQIGDGKWDAVSTLPHTQASPAPRQEKSRPATKFFPAKKAFSR